MEELKRICLEYKINNPVIGDELYNPTKYDGTKVFYPYSQKIKQICQNPKAFYSYLKDKREMLGFSDIKSPEYAKNYEENFLKLRCTLMYEIEGPLALTTD
jgi:hypothetical protein